MPNRRTKTNARAVLRTSSATAALQARARWGCNDARVATIALWMSREAFIYLGPSPHRPLPLPVGSGISSVFNWDGSNRHGGYSHSLVKQIFNKYLAPPPPPPLFFLETITQVQKEKKRVKNPKHVSSSVGDGWRRKTQSIDRIAVAGRRWASSSNAARDD